MMKNLKLIIIIVCVVITLLVVSLLVILNIEKVSMPNEIPYAEDEYNLTEELSEVNIRNNFYTVKTCIEKFYNTYAEIYSQMDGNFTFEGEALESIKNEQKNNITAVYNMLDEEYIKYNGITRENLETKLPQISQMDVEIDKMYVSEKTQNIYIYLVYGNLLDTKTAQNQTFEMIVKMDMLNKTFKVYLSDYVQEKYANIKIGDKIKISAEKVIQSNNDNIYQYKVISDEEHITNIFNSYKKDLLYNKSRAYKLLNTEYSNKRFRTQQDFNSYINDNLQKLATMTLSKYQKKVENGKNKYICIDQRGNYYIIKEENLRYTVILDTYTIDLPEFTEKYESAKDEEKVLLNIQKCFEAINNKDYNYVYNKLDQTFKNNNFKTLADFEKYMKDNTFNSNTVSSSNGKVQGNTYMYDITIKDSSGKDTNTIKKTFVMQLKEGTDFVMSFGI